MTTHALHSLTLTANEQLKPRLHRLTFHSDAFGDFPLSGPDEYFGLLMPQPGRSFEPFAVEGINVRAAVAALPDNIRPDLRWYTIRSLDTVRQLIDVDVVTHGDSGPGSRWIRRARPGDTAGMFTCPALWRPPESSQLLVADASALPALRHILAYLEANTPQVLAETDVVAVITDDAEVEDGLHERWGHRLRSLRVVDSSRHRETTDAVASVRYAYSPATAPSSVWVSGEGALVKEIRRLAVREWGVPADDVVWVPFWFHGKARP